MRIRLALIALVTGLLSIQPGEAVSQQTALTPGARVRLNLEGRQRKLEGSYVGRSPDTVWIRTRGNDTLRQALATDQIKEIEMLSGRKHPVGKSMLLGMWIGAGTGVIVGALVPPPCNPGTWCIGPSTPSEMALSGLVSGAIVGTLVGVVVGTIGHDHWVRASEPVWSMVSVQSGGRIGLTVPVKF